MAKIKVRLKQGIPVVSIAGPKSSLVLHTGEVAEVEEDFYYKQLTPFVEVVESTVLTQRRRGKKLKVVGEI